MVVGETGHNCCQKKPPDGGWGWMIVVAYGMANIIIIPVLQSFGLIFKDKFKDLNISATNAALIINLASAVGMAFGLFNGPLLRTFGYRKIGILGGFFFSTGLMMTSMAESFAHFIVTYSILASIGMGLCNSSFSLALNSYFVVRRNKAAGIAMTITGLGPIILPQLVSWLMTLYGPRGCLLIIGGLATHIMAAGCLLKPVERFMVDVVPEEEKMYSITKESTKPELLTTEEKNYLEKNDVDSQSLYGFEMIPHLRRRSLNISKIPRINSEVLNFHQVSGTPEPFRKRSNSVGVIVPKKKRWFEPESCESVNLGSSLNFFDRRKSEISINLGSSIKIFDDPPEVPKQVKKPDSIFMSIIIFFDLCLLKDPIYVNMMLGMSIAVFAEINFSILTPFILNDLGYVTNEIAAIMSTLACADLVFRFISPFIGDYLRLTPRVMYMISLVMLIITRLSILIAKNYDEMIFVAFCLGVAKGVRSVYMSLVIPSYIPIARLPSASSIQMMTNGIILMTIGPIVGLLRDITGSYSKSIIFINFFTAVTLTMWIIEMLYVRNSKKVLEH